MELFDAVISGIVSSLCFIFSLAIFRKPLECTFPIVVDLLNWLLPAVFNILYQKIICPKFKLLKDI